MAEEAIRKRIQNTVDRYAYPGLVAFLGLIIQGIILVVYAFLKAGNLGPVFYGGISSFSFGFGGLIVQLWGFKWAGMARIRFYRKLLKDGVITKVKFDREVNYILEVMRPRDKASKDN